MGFLPKSYDIQISLYKCPDEWGRIWISNCRSRSMHSIFVAPPRPHRNGASISNDERWNERQRHLDNSTSTINMSNIFWQMSKFFKETIYDAEEGNAPVWTKSNTRSTVPAIGIPFISLYLKTWPTSGCETGYSVLLAWLDVIKFSFLKFLIFASRVVWQKEMQAAAYRPFTPPPSAPLQMLFADNRYQALPCRWKPWH